MDTALINRRVLSWLGKLDPITKSMVVLSLTKQYLKCPPEEVCLEPECLDNALLRWLHETYRLGF
jgi:hypothetical protein